MRGACLDVKTGDVKIGSVRIGARDARPDKQMRPGALRPDPALLLPVLWMSVIAGMAHSTLESGAATQDGVAFRYQLKIRVKRPPGRGTNCPVFVKSGGGWGQLASQSAANGLMGRISTTVGATEPGSRNLQ